MSEDNVQAMQEAFAQDPQSVDKPNESGLPSLYTTSLYRNRQAIDLFGSRRCVRPFRDSVAAIVGAKLNRRAPRLFGKDPVRLEEKMMKAMLFALFIVCAVNAGEPSIVFDNRPEAGVPREALAQKLKLTAQEKLLGAKEYPVKFHTLAAGTIKTVRIRYFNKETWKSEKEAREYVAGFLGNKSSAVFGFQIWSQGVGVPEIECIVEFTDEHRKKLLAENKECLEGRLLIWNTESCFRDATGRWFFVDAFDQFHKSHPNGNRENAKGAKSK